MAAQTAHHVVNSTQSVGAVPPADVSGNNNPSTSLPAEAARADNPPIANAPSHAPPPSDPTPSASSAIATFHVRITSLHYHENVSDGLLG